MNIPARLTDADRMRALRDALDEAREEIRQLKALMVPEVVFDFPLPLQQLQILRALYARSPGVASREMLARASPSPSGDDDERAPKFVDVQLVRLRKALTAHGVEIHTHRSVGWSISAADKTKLDQHLMVDPMDKTAGLTVAVPTALFERLLKEAMARGVALSAHASERVVAALQGGAAAPVTSERELDLARQLKEMAAKAAEARNAALAARTATAALERRVTELTEKAQAASAPAPAPAEAEEAARLRKALADERAETQAQRREAGKLARHCEAWRARTFDLDAILAARDAELEKRARRIAELEGEVQKRIEISAPSIAVEKSALPAPVALAPVQIRAIRMFASLGHGPAWIARETDLPAEVIAAVLNANRRASK